MHLFIGKTSFPNHTLNIKNVNYETLLSKLKTRDPFPENLTLHPPLPNPPFLFSTLLSIFHRENKTFHSHYAAMTTDVPTAQISTMPTILFVVLTRRFLGTDPLVRVPLFRHPS